MKNFTQLTIFMILKFYKWPIYSAQTHKHVTKIWIYVTNMSKIDDFYLNFYNGIEFYNKVILVKLSL